MRKSTSLYLDFIRIAAALVVFIGHVSGKRFTDGLFWQMGKFMDDAVVVFFVLSGFVIAHVVSTKESTARSYFVARAARMYSVALPALVLTFVLDYIGKQLLPSSYSATWGYVEGNEIWQFISAITFTNELWFNKVSIGSMLPYWSLGYEVWYYIIFGLLFFSTSNYKWLVAVILLAITGPGIAMYFPIWILGYYAYRLSNTLQVRPAWSLGMFAASILVYAAFVLQYKDALSAFSSQHMLFGEKKVLQRYIVASLFTINLVAFAHFPDFMPRIPTGLEKAIRWLAGATFTIYLLHLPVAQFLATVTPWPASSVINRVFILAGTLGVLLLIAAFTERRKPQWQKWINAMLLPFQHTRQV